MPPSRKTGATVTASNASYDATISPGGAATLGLRGTWASSDAAPTSFTISGTACT